MRGFRRRGIQDRLRRNGGVPQESPTLTLEKVTSTTPTGSAAFLAGAGGSGSGRKWESPSSVADSESSASARRIVWGNENSPLGGNGRDDGLVSRCGEEDGEDTHTRLRGLGACSASTTKGKGEMYSPPLSQELDEWLAASAIKQRKLRTSSMTSSLWDDDDCDETASSFSDMSDSSMRMPASERRRMFSPGESSARRLRQSHDARAIKALADEFLCVSVGCVVLVMVAYLAHYLARHGVIDHTHITGF